MRVRGEAGELAARVGTLCDRSPVAPKDDDSVAARVKLPCATEPVIFISNTKWPWKTKARPRLQARS